MSTFHFSIADIHMEMDVSFPIEMTENYRPFLSDVFDQEHLDEKINVSLDGNYFRIPDDLIWEHEIGVSQTDKNSVYYRLGTGIPYLKERIRRSGVRDYVYRESSGERPDTVLKVFNNLGLENILLRHQAIILHSSLIRWRGGGILFSAPSGTGKSTQAELWKTYKGAEILNGDRAGLRKTKKSWRAYGLPYAGSSGIYRNESAPISAIVFLEQGRDNIIEAVSAPVAFRYLMTQTTIHQWDVQYMDTCLALLQELAENVPAYHLRCRPDEGAVERLSNIVMRNHL